MRDAEVGGLRSDSDFSYADFGAQGRGRFSISVCTSSRMRKVMAGIAPYSTAATVVQKKHELGNIRVFFPAMKEKSKRASQRDAR